ncbi:hypothetical protein BH721_01970 [Clostridium baratii]|uniref:Uncharacterized protein n=1 Tax=Clostridium baratii TaxID=1561 RepID=A0A174R0B9_9CLOT|nr:hypothetical protein [Clostridium baratii]OPF51429.1 hypothetical protein A1M12_02505 [Clostridium baratii]OPF55498.1 hypothetical protein BH721_01970 [Clostridium baratii]OPF57123.1 hypothetical protein BH724_11460 [Clostridium baratii]OPF60121.1 hypothetical protein BH725_05955 [Clostridium baratii]CUP78884.1 Uncharacterised protein [Clostridium baratii]
MKDIKDFFDIDKSDEKFHRLTLKNDKEKLLGEKKASEIKDYFHNLKDKNEEKDKDGIRVLVPKDAYKLKALIDDLNTILNS